MDFLINFSWDDITGSSQRRSSAAATIASQTAGCTSRRREIAPNASLMGRLAVISSKSSSPRSGENSKTGAAVRSQAPVVVSNLLAVIDGKEPQAQYQGYSSCPLTTARNKMLLAEFDYTLTPKPSIPMINTIKERRDMWYLKRYGLPFMYWNMMLKGRA